MGKAWIQNSSCERDLGVSEDYKFNMSWQSYMVAKKANGIFMILVMQPIIKVRKVIVLSYLALVGKKPLVLGSSLHKTFILGRKVEQANQNGEKNKFSLNIRKYFLTSKNGQDCLQNSDLHHCRSLSWDRTTIFEVLSQKTSTQVQIKLDDLIMSLPTWILWLCVW